MLLSAFSHMIQKMKEHILHKWGFIVFYSKNNFCIMVKSNWFDFIHYAAFTLIYILMVYLLIYLLIYPFNI